MPTSVEVSSASRSTSHSAMPFRVQYLRGDGGGCTSTGGRIAIGHVDAQALQAGGRRLRARIVDADGAANEAMVTRCESAPSVDPAEQIQRLAMPISTQTTRRFTTKYIWALPVNAACKLEIELARAFLSPPERRQPPTIAFSDAPEWPTTLFSHAGLLTISRATLSGAFVSPKITVT